MIQPIRSFKAHNKRVNCIRLLADNRIATCSDEKNIGIWNFLTGELIKSLSADYETEVLHVEKLPNNRLVSSYVDGCISVWCLETSRCLIRKEDALDEGENTIGGIKVFPNDKLLSCSGNTLKLWDLTWFVRLTTFVGHTDDVVCADVLPDERVISGSEDKTIKIWNQATGKCMHTLKGYADAIRCVLVLSNNRIITGSKDNMVKVWDLNDYSLIRTLNGHKKCVIDLSQNETNKIVSRSNDEIRVWNLDSGDCVETIQINEENYTCLQTI